MRRADDKAIQFVAGTNHGPLRPLLDLADRAAVLFLPWAGVSASLLRSGAAGARTALVRGWSAVALSSLVDDGLIKPLTHRQRPAAERFPPKERRHREPSTSSFPSGHVGAAAAFAAGTWRDAPPLHRPLMAIALVTGYAHVYTGRHHLSDAAMGAAIGAAAGVLVNSVGSSLPSRSATDANRQ